MGIIVGSKTNNDFFTPYLNNENALLMAAQMFINKKMRMEDPATRHILEVAKADGSYNLANTYDAGARFLSPIAVRRALMGTVNLSKNLSQCGFSIQAPLAGQISKHTAAENVLYPGTIGSSERRPKYGTTSLTSYTCKHARFDITVNWDVVHNSIVDNGENFMPLILRDVSKSIANSIAEMAWNGDTTLVGTDDQSMTRKVADGWLKQGKASGVYRQAQYDAKRGTMMDFNDLSMFIAMKRNMPLKYRHGDNAFFMTSAMVDSYLHYLTTYETTTAQEALRNGEAITQQKILGQPYILVPQMSENEAADIAAAAPTAVADDGDGTMTVRVHTILPDTTDYTGRKVRVILASSGAYEDCFVRRNTSSQNIIETTGALGQTSISTNAALYTVQPYGTIGTLLTHPKNLETVMGQRFYLFVRFVPEAMAWEFTGHIWLCFIIHEPTGLVYVDNMLPLVSEMSFDLPQA